MKMDAYRRSRRRISNRIEFLHAYCLSTQVLSNSNSISRMKELITLHFKGIPILGMPRIVFHHGSKKFFLQKEVSILHYIEIQRQLSLIQICSKNHLHVAMQRNAILCFLHTLYILETCIYSKFKNTYNN